MRRDEIDRLGDELCELSAHIAAATYRWLVLLARFDAENGWAHWGCRSCAHWLNWRCGLDLRSAREKVRVARALADLPLISDAFSRGEISYSKVRAITRIVTPATEADLLGFAKAGTTQHVEKIVRGYRRCLPPEEADERHDRRYVHISHDADGSLIIRARLDPEDGALVVKAIEKLRAEVAATNREPDAAEGGSAEPPRDRADALVEMARRTLAGSKHEGSSAERFLVTVHVDASVLADSDGACHLEDGSALTTETVRRLTCDGSIVTALEDTDGTILNIGRKTRTVPPSIRRALKIRDDTCMFPGCTCAAFLDAHHVTHWSKGGETSLANLVLVCTYHHRLLHEGGFSLRIEHDGRFTFLGLDGEVIETAAFSVEPRGVEAMNDALGLHIDPTTPVPQWLGEGCDYSVAIDGLIRRAERVA